MAIADDLAKAQTKTTPKQSYLGALAEESSGISGEVAAQGGRRRQAEHHGHGEGKARVPVEDAAQGGRRRQAERDEHVDELQQHWQVGECSATAQRRQAGHDGHVDELQRH